MSRCALLLLPCRVTGREKPDFWVSDPTRSIVVEVTSDIRTIASNVYAADHSLRFPRIKRVRYVCVGGCFQGGGCCRAGTGGLYRVSIQHQPSTVPGLIETMSS